MVPPRLSAQGQRTGGSVGRRGRTGGFGVGWGAAPIHFKDGTGSSLSSVSPCRLLLRNHRLTSCAILYVCDSARNGFWMCGLGIKLAHAHFTSEHSPSFRQTHTLHTQTQLSPLQALLSKPTHGIVCVVQLFLADCVWEGQSHRR